MLEAGKSDEHSKFFIPAPPEKIMKAIVSTPPPKKREWKYLQRREANRQS